MSWVAAIWVTIIVVRWVLPAVIGFFSQGPSVPHEWGRRGKVLGHRGPDSRSFKGRAGRREWWLTTLGNSVAGGIVGAVPTIGTLLALPWIIGGLAVNARRLHDLSMSAWLQLIPMAFGTAAAAGYFALGQPQNPLENWSLATPTGVFTAFATLAGLIYLTFYIWIGFMPGRRGSNCYAEADA